MMHMSIEMTGRLPSRRQESMTKSLWGAQTTAVVAQYPCIVENGQEMPEEIVLVDIVLDQPVEHLGLICVDCASVILI